MIRGIIKITVEDAGNDEFVRRGSSEKKKIKYYEKNGEWFRKDG